MKNYPVGKQLIIFHLAYGQLSKQIKRNIAITVDSR